MERASFLSRTAKIHSAAIKTVRTLQCPPLGSDDVAYISGEEPVYITRHIEARYLSRARKGYYRFGTLMNYRGQENAISGRLGDPQEGRKQTTLNSRTGKFESAVVENLMLSKVQIPNNGSQVTVETVVNDFCSCSSIGKFNPARGQKLKEFEEDVSKKLGAFVVYHLPTLKLALLAWFRQRSDLSSMVLVGRDVAYSLKDQVWSVGETFRFKHALDPINEWLEIAFVKSPRFSHEDEYRLLLINPDAAGSLGRDAKDIEIEENERIAAAIRVSDYY